MRIEPITDPKHGNEATLRLNRINDNQLNYAQKISSEVCYYMLLFDWVFGEWIFSWGILDFKLLFHVIHWETCSYIKRTEFYTAIIFLDINECGNFPCDDNATCINHIGSFGCLCLQGFRGNGFECQGGYTANYHHRYREE